MPDGIAAEGDSTQMIENCLTITGNIGLIVKQFCFA
jgi:hypothetical protein